MLDGREIQAPENPPSPIKPEEQPWHRQALHLFIAGATARTIADTLNQDSKSIITKDAVQQLLKQPWFKAEACEMIDTAGRAALEATFMNYYAEASLKMVNLMRNSPDEGIQFKAAQDILDRVLPKNVNMRHTHTKETIPPESILDAEITELQNSLGTGNLPEKS